MTQELNFTALTKYSNQVEIKTYFTGVLRASQSNEAYPVSLDDVWGLVYSDKGKAVRALRENFIQDVDYKVIAMNGKNPIGGRPSENYYLTTSCLEYFIARKVREVFEVYRQVFHNIAESQFKIPKTFAEALRLGAEQQEQIEQLSIEIAQKDNAIYLKDKFIEEQAPKVRFAESITESSDSILIAELAKIITQNGFTIGQNRLYIWMRENGYLGTYGSYYNLPTQKSMEMKLFEVKKTSIQQPNGTTLVSTTTKVTGKGQLYFINKFISN